MKYLLVFVATGLCLFFAGQANSQTSHANPDSIPFAPAINYPAGDGPHAVFCADLNGDSAFDLAVADNGSDSVSVFINLGSGALLPRIDYPVSDRPFSVFCADLDGDSALDLTVANYNSNNVSTLLNTGDGTFGDATNHPVGANPLSVFCAHLDADSYVDLVTANGGSDNISILKNNGDGSFQPQVDLSSGDRPRSVFCVDLNGDSCLDLAVANSYSNDVSIFLNDCNGNFELNNNYAVGNGPYSLFCADLDGDTDVDIVTANRLGNTVSVLMNNGDGTFGPDSEYVAAEGPYSVFCADLDGDSDLDLAVANYESDNVSILENNGDGTFGPRVDYTAGLENGFSVFCGDMDGDGDLDMVVAWGGSDSVSIFFNQSICPAGNILVYAKTDKDTYNRHSFDEDLPAILRDHGYSVAITDRSETDSLTEALLADYDELWLLTSDYSPGSQFDSSELEAIRSFRDQDKGLVIMSDDANYQVDANQIAQPLGVTFHGTVDHGSYCTPIVPDFEAHPLVVGVDTIVGYPSEGRIRVDSAGVEVVGTYHGDTLIAALDDGKGRVVFDVSFTKLFDGCVLTGQMPQYVRNIADWLGHREPVCSLLVVTDTTCLSSSEMKVTLFLANQNTIGGMTIPLWLDSDCPGFAIDSVVFDSTRIEDWEYKNPDIRADTLILALVADMGGGTPCLPPGEGPIAFIYFNVDCDTLSVGDTCHVSVDTVTFQPDDQGLLFVDCEARPYVPYFERGTTWVAQYRSGDANGDCFRNLADVIHLLNYLFKDGPEPTPLDAGDANGDCVIDIGDPVYLLNYLFKGGPPPVCGCASNPELAGSCQNCVGWPRLSKTVGEAEVGLVSAFAENDGESVLEVTGTLGVDVAGLQLDIAYDPQTVTSIVPALTERTGSLQIFSNERNGLLKVGLVDLGAKNVIKAGEGPLLRLKITGSEIASVDISKAVLVDVNANPLSVRILPKSENQIARPTRFALHQNYPNPFNPETDISYSIPVDGRVMLSIYNVKGQKVKTLVECNQAAGHYTVRWDGRDERGNQVASGVYFYRIQAGEFEDTKKMILMK